MNAESEESEESEESQVHFGCPSCLSVFRLGFSRCPIDGNVLQKLVDDPLIGTTIADRYLIEACIGEGGMGRVYRARHQRVSRQFAIKILFGELSTDPKMRARFSREAEAASRLSHANVISVMDFGESKEGLLYLVMDFVEGRELAKVIADEGPFSSERVKAISKQLCAGLSHAHEEGLVHRDFKGENVILSQRGPLEVPRIVDFGIAVILEDTESRLTTQGMIIGTPAYMSPEQVTGKALDHRSDLYSLGILLYEMLAGVQPFDGDPMEVARQNMSSKPPAIRERVPGLEVDAHLERIALKLLAKLPEDRFQDANEVAAALAAQSPSVAAAAPSVTDMVAQSSSRRRPLLIALAALALIALMGSVVVLGRGGSESNALSVADAPADAGTTIALAAPLTDAAPPRETSLDVDAARVGADAAGSEPDDALVRRKDRKHVAKPVDDPPVKETPPTVTTSVEPREAKSDPKTADTPPPPPTSQALTRLYISVGESIQKLQKSHPERVVHYRSQYSSIPFNDALRVPALRKEVETKLQRLATALKKEP